MSRIFSPVLQLEDVTVDYIGNATGHPALDRISLVVEQGTWVAVAGDNGSGKSTLAKAAAGLSPLTDGKVITADGIRVHMVMQHPEIQILGETVYEEIWLSLPEDSPAAVTEREAQMKRYLRESGLQHVPLHTPVRLLSGGQKQLLNIACCLAAGADVLLFDESLSMLDPSSRSLVLEAASRLHAKGTTILWISHRMEELVYADRILLLEEGRLAYDGTPVDFFYGNAVTGQLSPCESFGLEPPLTVQTVKELHKYGVDWPERPLTPDQLAKAVNLLCR
ncbi:energy-coupling factor ABC transporter ATP-binding protein [Paenibacillus gansuensis]|uniref:Energy-coupling factor ABC transporter ATP-binding protein n=1 Tax=Paenibacillus gansuensis TaxID=306542 RepID=A0ABW5P8Y7_9BACL